MKNIHLVINILLTSFLCSAEHLIVVEKMDVLHKFVPFDAETDRFVRDIFKDWESETFEVFNTIKNPEGIAIDLGAWIGTTSIWLSKHFDHVIAVEADRESLRCLEQNLAASECGNVTICPRPLAREERMVVFGPRGSVLNQSISCIQETMRNENDYLVESITLNSLISGYVGEDATQKISFIKCDIEGGEEEILEDLLLFAFTHQCKVYLSFHVDWWKKKDVQRFKRLFALFHTNEFKGNITAYIQSNPFGSLLLTPRKHGVRRGEAKRDISSVCLPEIPVSNMVRCGS